MTIHILCTICGQQREQEGAIAVGYSRDGKYMDLFVLMCNECKQKTIAGDWEYKNKQVRDYIQICEQEKTGGKENGITQRPA
jgi:hypothetical protein